MTPRNLSLVGRLSQAPILRNAWLRRLVLALIVGACAVLTLFPQQYRAALSLTPADPASLGLAATVSQLGALNSVFGNQSAVEVSLKLGTSPYVRNKVAERLKLEDKLGMTRQQALRWLYREVDVRSMRGGIIQIETKLPDGELGKQIVGAYGDAIREQLAIIGRNQTQYKRDILVELVTKASDELQVAQSRYDSFRLQTRYSQPQAAISAIGERIPLLEQAIQSKQVELNAKRQFATDDNMIIREVLAEIASLQEQLREARSVSPTDQNSVGRVVRQSTEADRLRRDLDLAQSLYDNYKRYLQGTSVEDLTSTANMRILEPAFIDPARQYNWVFFGIGALFLLLGLAIEFYNLRPPVRAVAVPA